MSETLERKDLRNEDERLAALALYQILDTKPEEPFDRITRVLSNVLDVPTAFVTFIERERIWFKSTYGADVNECARNGAFCDLTIKQDNPLIVKDAKSDPRFMNNPFVVGPAGIRFYAGTPLRAPGGVNLGTLCVFDVRPRDLDQRQLSLLDDLAALVIDELELRRATKDALSEGEQRFRDFANATSDWFWEMDETLTFCYFSERMTEVVGISIDEVLGKKRQETGIEKFCDPQAYRSHLEDLAAHRPFRNFIHGRQRKNGDLAWFSISGVPYFDSLGKFKGYRGTGTDITERVKAEESLRKADEQMRQAQKMEAVGQLTGGVAHDFNNLLGVIIGNLEILQDGFQDGDNGNQLLEAALRASLRGVDMTNRLLAFSRRQTLKPEVCDLNALVNGMTEMLQRMLGATVPIQTHLAGELWPTEIDPAQLESALLNLAVNARHAMPDGGELTVSTRNVTLGLDYASRHQEVTPGRYALLTVSDSGSGIPSEILDKVFEPFFTTKDVGEGSGLGLSMVHGFVKQSGGHVTIASQNGAGTTVEIYFPASDRSLPSGQDAKQAACKPAEPGETILIVEDDPELRELAVKAVSGLGYQTVDVPDGPAALAVLRDGSPVDLLFTDVVLPQGMNGAELAERALVLRPGLKILFTSGYAENVIEENGVLRPQMELLNKPYRRAELANRLRQILEEGEAWPTPS